jgi:hypothetical protein
MGLDGKWFGQIPDEEPGSVAAAVTGLFDHRRAEIKPDYVRTLI